MSRRRTDPQTPTTEPPPSGVPRVIESIADLVQDGANANRGTQRGSLMLRASMERNGAGRSVVADRNGRLIAGNKTAEAARDAGLPVRVVQTDGSELVVVQRTDLDLNDPRGRARELAFADNRVGEVNLDWSPDAIKDAFAAGAMQDIAYLFDGDELNRIVGEALVVDLSSLDGPSGSQDASGSGGGQLGGGDPWNGQGNPDGAAADGVDFRLGDLGGRVDKPVYEAFRALVERVRSRGVVMMSDILAEVVRLADSGDPGAFDGDPTEGG